MLNQLSAFYNYTDPKKFVEFAWCFMNKISDWHNLNLKTSNWGPDMNPNICHSKTEYQV